MSSEGSATLIYLDSLQSLILLGAMPSCHRSCGKIVVSAMGQNHQPVRQSWRLVSQLASNDPKKGTQRRGLEFSTSDWSYNQLMGLWCLEFSIKGCALHMWATATPVASCPSSDSSGFITSIFLLKLATHLAQLALVCRKKNKRYFNYARKIWVLGSKEKVTTSSVCLKILIPKITYQHIICPNVFQHIIPKYSKYLITQLLRPQLRKQTGRWCIGWMGLGSSGCNMWWTRGRDVSISFVWGGTGKETHLVGVCGFSWF